MKNRIRLFAGLLPAVAVLLACDLAGISQTAESAINTAAATVLADTPSAATPAGGDASGKIIFEDDFSNDSGDWDDFVEDYGTTGYEDDGTYKITIEDTSSYLTAKPGKFKDAADVVIDVDVLASDKTPHDAGVVCRYKDIDNFYYLMFSSDGWYAIGKFVDGEEALIGAEEMIEDTDLVINRDYNDNQLRGECIGSTLALYVNGTKLFETTDTDLDDGNVGLIAGAYDDVPITALFDNFVVSKP
jgi:hypothetical protein